MEQENKTTEQQDVPQAALTADDLVELYFLVEDKIRYIKLCERSEREFLYWLRNDTESEEFTETVRELDQLALKETLYDALLGRLNEALGAEPID